MTPILILLMLGFLLIKLWTTERKVYKETIITRKFDTFKGLYEHIEEMEELGYKVKKIRNNKVFFVKSIKK